MAQGSWEAEGEEKKEEEEGAQRRLELTGAGFTIKHGDSMGFSQEIGIYNQCYGDIMIAHYWILHDCWFGSRSLRRNCSSDGHSGLWFRLVLGVLGLYWYFNSLPWNITVFQWIIPRWQFSITEHIPISLALSGKVKAVAEEAGWLDLKWRFSMVA